MTACPSAISFFLFLLCLFLFIIIFLLQNSLFVLGSLKCFGHPCQKHPWMNTATSPSFISMSGLPVIFGCILCLIFCPFSMLCALFSGDVHFDLIPDIISLLFSLLNMSAMLNLTTRIRTSGTCSWCLCCPRQIPSLSVPRNIRHC